MSPRPGGETDKFGNRYEGAWTVRHLLYVLQGRGDALTVEDIGELAKGSEFTYRHGDVVEVHQVKRQNGNANNWTVKSLQQKQIWDNARYHVERGRHFHFVSTVPARHVEELSDRARRSDSLDSFLEHWLGQELREHFDELASSAVYGSAETAWTVLRGFWAEWSSEKDVVRVNATLAELLLEGGDGPLAAAGLGDLLANALGTTLDKAAVEDRLTSYGLKRRAAAQADGVAAAVDGITAGWAAQVERELLRPVIARPESTELSDLIASGDHRLVLLSGAAGGGKTAVLGGLHHLLVEAGAPTLAFRLDRLGSFATTSELGGRLGLGLSPVAALATVAGDRRSVLVIDQLDAVSMVSGRMPDTFDAVADLVREASAFPAMRVILACRTFDVDHDHRIRQLVDDRQCARVEVAALSDAHVAEALAAMGIEATTLNSRQRKLLRSPLHLVLLKEIAGDGEALSFETTKNLFDAYWRRKLTACTRRRQPVRFAEVVSALAEAISDRQRLSVPASVLDRDDLALDAGVLVSEHILVEDRGQLAFFHETFFDYAFARSWVGRGQRMVEFLTQGEQELFRRAQVRQILNHLRDDEPDRFADEIESLLTSPDIRYHLKDVVLALLADLPEPSAGEWEAVAAVLRTHPSCEARLWQVLRKPQWFVRLDAEGLVEEWLDGSPDEQERAVGIMAAGASGHPDRVAGILRSRADRPACTTWLRWILRFADLPSSRALFDLLLRAVRADGYAEADHELWFSARDVATHEPAWAVELLAAHLVHRPGAMTAAEDGSIVALRDRDHGAISLVQQAAKGAPRLFCELMVPYMVDVMARTALDRPHHDPVHDLAHDRHFSFRHPDDQPHELGGALLKGSAAALITLAGHDAERARPILESLASCRFETAQWLLYQALAAAPEQYAGWTARLLLGGVHRFFSGYVSNSVWAAREVLRRTSPYFSDQEVHQLETAILAMRLPWERRRPGWYMFNLLSALDETRLSERGRRRLGELRRLFNSDEPEHPQGVQAVTLGSPIPQESARRMNDDQWLAALRKHDGDRRDWQHLKGGAHELSLVLRTQATEDPARFGRLALRFDERTHPSYGSAVLLALGEADALSDPTPVYDAVRHLATLEQPGCDRWLGWALRRYHPAAPLDLVQILVDRAVNSSDPADDRPVIRTEGPGRTPQDDLYASGMNSVRGSAAETLGDLLIYDADGSRTALVRPVLDRMASDPAPSVRACVAHLLLAAMRHALPEAVAAYGHLVDTDDALLAAQPVTRLTAHIGRDHAALVRPVTERMLASLLSETRTAGGFLSALAALQWGMPDLLESVLAGQDVAARQGAAQVVAHTLTNTQDAALLRRAFKGLVSDAEPSVRKAAAEMAAAVRGQRLRPLKEPLMDLIASAAFPDALPQLLITLEHAPDRVNDLVAACIHRFVDVHGTDAGDIRTGAAADAHHVGELLIRAYAQSPTRSGRKETLDLLDRLLEVGAFGVAKVVDEAERGLTDGRRSPS